MSKYEKLEIGLPFKVSAVQAVQFYASKKMRPTEISRRLRSLGASQQRISQAFTRWHKLEQIERRKVAENVGGIPLRASDRTDSQVDR